jgi:ribosome-binding protein aMBF1 (putative translation factor)
VIRSDTELEEIRAKLQEQEARVVAYRIELEKDGLPSADIERAVEPVRAFAIKLEETIEEYERVRNGELPSIASLEDLGPALVAARIAAGVTQRELAVRLRVHESQVSRDERNDYHGVTLERAAKLLDVIGVSFRGTLSLAARADAEGRRF